MTMNFRSCAGVVAAALVLGVAPAGGQVAGTDAGADANQTRHHRSVYHVFEPITQGPLWPPSAVVDENGDFVVVGTILEPGPGGRAVPVPGAAIVSKDTVPPADFSDPFAAPYDVLRPLDLSYGSPDRHLGLYSVSMGPAADGTTGAPRIPDADHGAFDLNGSGVACPEFFPSAAQSTSLHRASYPLHQVPIWGFQGDQVVYDADSGEPVDAPNENVIDVRPRDDEITLGDWTRGRSSVYIRLRGYDHAQHAFTRASFRFRFRRLLPNSVYSLWFVRRNVVDPRPVPGRPDPVSLPGVFATDSWGRASFQVTVDNPFPAPDEDDAGLRIIGIAGVLHSDFQYWGACPGRYGSGVDVHEFINTRAEGIDDLTSLVTRAPR